MLFDVRITLQTLPRPMATDARHFENTPDVWKAASRGLNDISGGDKDRPGMINLEPDILKHVFYSMTGGPGRTLDQTIDATQATARGNAVTPNRLPLFGVVMTGYVAARSWEKVRGVAK